MVLRCVVLTGLTPPGCHGNGNNHCRVLGSQYCASLPKSKYMCESIYEDFI